MSTQSAVQRLLFVGQVWRLLGLEDAPDSAACKQIEGRAATYFVSLSGCGCGYGGVYAVMVRSLGMPMPDGTFLTWACTYECSTDTGGVSAKHEVWAYSAGGEFLGSDATLEELDVHGSSISQLIETLAGAGAWNQLDIALERVRELRQGGLASAEELVELLAKLAELP